MRTQIYTAQTRAARQAAFRLRYEVYEVEQKRRLPFADHSGRLLTDALDACSTIINADVDGETCGTLRLTPLTSSVPSYCQYFEIDRLPPGTRSSMVSRLVVTARQRKTTVAHRLCCEGYVALLQSGNRYSFITANPSHGLLPFFMHLGYKAMGAVKADPQFGPSIPLCLDMFDSAHLRSVRSPFLRLLDAYKDRTEIMQGAH